MRDEAQEVPPSVVGRKHEFRLGRSTRHKAMQLRFEGLLKDHRPLDTKHLFLDRCVQDLDQTWLSHWGEGIKRPKRREETDRAVVLPEERMIEQSAIDFGSKDVEETALLG